MQDIAAFTHELRAQVRSLAKNLTGEQVSAALFITTDALFDSGVDKCWEAANIKDRAKVADVFCVTWLTSWIIELQRMQCRK